MNKWRAVVLCGLLNNFSIAADPIGNAERFAPERMPALVFDQTVTPQWFGAQSEFWYRYKSQAGVKFWRVNPARRAKEPLFDLNKVTEEIVRLSDPTVTPAKIGETLEVRVKNSQLHLTHAEQEYRCALYQCEQLEKVTVSSTPATELLQASRSPDGQYTVFVRDHNLFVVDDAGLERPLTQDGTAERSYAIESLSKYDERQVTPVNWFGDSSSLFYVQRWDWREIAPQYLLNSLSEPRPTVSGFFESLSEDEKLQQHELWVFDAVTGKGMQIDTERWPGQTIGHLDLGGGFGRAQSTGVFPSPDATQLFFVRHSRGYTERELCVANPVTGAVRVLIHEEDLQHIDIRYPVLEFLGNSGDFVWLTERDGRKHLDRYDSNGRLQNPVTAGDFNVIEILAVDAPAQRLWFSVVGSNTHPHEVQIASASWEGGLIQILTPGEGHRRASAQYIAPQHDYFIDNFSRVDVPARSLLRNAQGEVVLDLETTDTSALDAVGWRAPERVQLKAADGRTDLHGVMFKPFDFDPGKKYPLIAYVYPGPGTNATFALEFDPTESWMADATALAQQGFVVVEVGLRGSSTYRDRKFALHGHRQPRDFALADLRTTIETLRKRHSFIDPQRAGIWGYSSGGFLSATAILSLPKLFQVAVAGAGNHDNNLYEQNSTEFHFGPPPYPTNMALAGKLEGRLLLVHGDADRDVVLAHSLRLTDALIKAGKHVDMLIVPGLGHGEVAGLPYYHRRVWRYFAEHLLGQKSLDATLLQPPSVSSIK